MPEGMRRWLALVPDALGVWLFFKLIRRAREIAADAE